MLVAKTPIRILTEMRNVADERHDAAEEASNLSRADYPDWSLVSRTWLRQSESIINAIVVEPPQSMDDVQAVLLNLATCRSLTEDDRSNDTPSTARACEEMTDVAIHNCIAALARLHQPEHDWTEADVDSLRWSNGRVARWLPEPRTAWDEAKAVYLTAKQVLDAYDDAAPGNSGEEADRLTDVRSAAEDVLMAIPSPDAAAFAFKHLIAHGEGRETDTWNGMLEQEARGFARDGGL